MGTNDCCCGRLNTAQGTRIIAIVSAVISVLAFIGFTSRIVQLSVTEVPESEPIPERPNLLLDNAGRPRFTAQQTTEFLKEQIRIEKLIVGILSGVSVVSFLVAILLILAVKKNNGNLALPYMVWTILCTAAAGMFGITLLIAFPAIHGNQLVARSPDDTQHLVLGLVMPFVFVVVMFKLYTWWLIVVFNFYNRLKFSAGEPPFDGIQMQTA